MVSALKGIRKWQILVCLVLMCISLLVFVQKAGAVAGQVDANNVTTAPTINGQLTEAGWSLANTVSKTTIGTPNNTVTMGAMWNSTHLFIGVRVLDANLNNDSANIWDDDSVEIFIDGNHNAGATYDSFDRQFIKGYNDTTLFASGSSTGVQHAWAAITGGYSVELAIPWSNLGITPTANMIIGFDVAYNDDDNAGARDSQAVWWGTINNYNNTSAFGDIKLMPSGTPPPTTPPPTTPPPTTPPPTTPPPGQTPYPNGTPWAIPGTIQAENFDNGSDGVAYHDTDAANTGGQYRPSTGVDIEVTGDTGGGYNVGWTRTDEWLEYTVNVATAGTYIVNERVASGATTGSFRIEFNGVNKTGTVTVPNTGGWQTYQTLSQSVNLSAGQQIMRIYFQGNDTNLNYVSFSMGTPPPTTPPPTTPPPTTPPPTTPPPTTPPPTTPPPGQRAYPNGTPWAIPGTIQAENYDLGGEGVAFHDVETANQGGQYRTTEGVDVQVSTDTGGGYNVGWIRTDEWMEYTVNVAQAGNYTLVERVASPTATGSFRVEFNGVNKTGTVIVPNTGGWQTYQNLSQTVSLSAGQQVMRIYFLGNDINLNSFTLTPVSSSALSYKVHLFYYSWYGTPATDGTWVHWNQNQFGFTPPDSISSDFYPTLGPYSSKDTAILQQHMQMIAQARIGVIIVSWWGQGSREDTTIPAILDAAAPYGIKVGFHMEPYGGRTAQSTVNDINYINSRYGSHAAYYRAQDRGNKPVFYIFNSLAITDWSPLTAVNGNNIILTQTTDQSKVTYFGGMYNYSVNSNEPNIRELWTGMNNYCVANGKVWSPSIGPGYIDARATGNTLNIPRENGAKYDRDWSDAIASGAQWISITSFNEWHEGSQIEPARNSPPPGYGYLTYLNAYGRTGSSAEVAYMDRTRYWVDIFNP